jgi:hypothetical protein
MNVYLIWHEGTSLYKIGKSDNPADRLKRLQTGHSGKLHLIAQMQCSDALRKETYLHLKYKNLRTTGEWFNIPPTMLQEVFAEFQFHVEATPDTPIYYWASLAQSFQLGIESVGKAVSTAAAAFLSVQPVVDLQKEITQGFLLELLNELPPEIIGPQFAKYSRRVAEMRLLAEQVGFADSYGSGK